MAQLGAVRRTGGEMTRRPATTRSAMLRLCSWTAALSITALTLGSSLVLPAAAAASGNQFKPVAPTRVLDTRPSPNNTGNCSPSPCKTLGPNSSVDVTVAGSGTPAPSGATAVVLNVSAVPSASSPPSFLTIYAQGQSRPNVSNVNTSGGQLVQNLVTVPVNSGKVTVYNNAGNTDVIFDEAGYYQAPSGNDGQYTPQPPSRVFDTRGSPFGPTGTCYQTGSNTTVTCAALGAGQSMDVQIGGKGGVP